jgi:hypothetical protein
MSWLRQLFHRHQIYNDFAEEIRQHLAEKVEALFEFCPTRPGLYSPSLRWIP